MAARRNFSNFAPIIENLHANYTLWCPEFVQLFVIFFEVYDRYQLHVAMYQTFVRHSSHCLNLVLISCPGISEFSCAYVSLPRLFIDICVVLCHCLFINTVSLDSSSESTLKSQ